MSRVSRLVCTVLLKANVKRFLSTTCHLSSGVLKRAETESDAFRMSKQICIREGLLLQRSLFTLQDVLYSGYDLVF